MDAQGGQKMSLTRKHLVRKLPSGYFGDCQISHFEARQTASSDTSQKTNALTTADTQAAASTIPASSSAGVCSTDEGVAGGGERSHAAGIPDLSGPASLRFTTKDQSGDTHVLMIDKVQLHAARVISGMRRDEDMHRIPQPTQSPPSGWIPEPLRARSNRKLAASTVRPVGDV